MCFMGSIATAAACCPSCSRARGQLPPAEILVKQLETANRRTAVALAGTEKLKAQLAAVVLAKEKTETKLEQTQAELDVANLKLRATVKGGRRPQKERWQRSIATVMRKQNVTAAVRLPQEPPPQDGDRDDEEMTDEMWAIEKGPVAADQSGVLPGWEAHTSKTRGRTYYYNKVTDETKWRVENGLPVAAVQQAEAVSG